jgi:hypothetical protein
LLSLDPELWRRSDPDAFLAFSQRAATQYYLKHAEMEALGLQGLSCEGSFYSPVGALWLVVALYCWFVVSQDPALRSLSGGSGCLDTHAAVMYGLPARSISLAYCE